MNRWVPDRGLEIFAPERGNVEATFPDQLAEDLVYGQADVVAGVFQSDAQGHVES